MRIAILISVASLVCSGAIAADDMLVSVTTNYVSECRGVTPWEWDSDYYYNNLQYVGYPKNLGELTSGVITNENHYFMYGYSVGSINVTHSYSNSVDGIYGFTTNHFVCVQSNSAIMVICSLATNENGSAIFEGILSIPDILVGDDKSALVYWVYLGSPMYGSCYGPALDDHSFDRLTSIVIPDGYSVPKFDIYSLQSYQGPYVGCETYGSLGFWNLHDITFLGSPECFTINDYIATYSARVAHPIGMMLPFADQINITEKYSAQWLKILRNIGYGGNVHVIGSGVTNRLNKAVAGSVSITTTNVVIHYVQNVAQSAAVSPVTSETGFVNVITEIKGGNVAVPDSWATNYPNFVSRFGSDFTKALMMPTKKKDGANNPMLVWQDYVAGTDPTKEDDVFKASITRDENGKIIISHTPEFKDANEKEKRKYTTLGKKSLMDSADWEVVPEGHEADYNFFKVTVKMKP